AFLGSLWVMVRQGRSLIFKHFRATFGHDVQAMFRTCLDHGHGVQAMFGTRPDRS
ncbi:Hypothetical predicted protein, partial [Olea europaea subsp. europaea]